MRFEELLQKTADGKTAPKSDSRLAGPGDTFIALPPATAKKELPDPSFVRGALENGAGFIVYPAAAEDSLAGLFRQFPGSSAIPVDDSAEALGKLAAAHFGTEGLPFPVIAVTGTNGKTTTAYILEHLFESCGKKTGVLGTVSYRWPGHSEAAPLTTPGCLALHGYLAEMRNAGAEAAIMEVSSHALDQNRVAGIRFAAAIFTNLTQDHLDYHGDMESYFNAKTKLFTQVPDASKVCAVNCADPYGKRLAAICPSALTFEAGFLPHEKSGSKARLYAQIERCDTSGLTLLHTFGGQTWRMRSPLVGEHNAFNLLGAEAAALGLGFSPKDMKGLEGFRGVPGRLERIEAHDADTGIFVDYAHTPDALDHALGALRKAGFGRIIAVFGCGGDRDRTKRPLMGKAVREGADIAILTSDNPRTEDPEKIMDDVMPGLEGMREVHREADRRKALALAVKLIKPGDALLVAGKGHEPYQIIGKTKYPFSDQQILKELLA